MNKDKCALKLVDETIQNTHFRLNNFFSRNRAVFKKNIVERGRPEMTIRRTRIACCVPKATNTNSEHVILIGFPLYKWLRERTSMLRHTYIACLFFLLWSDLGIYIYIYIYIYIVKWYPS